MRVCSARIRLCSNRIDSIRAKRWAASRRYSAIFPLGVGDLGLSRRLRLNQDRLGLDERPQRFVEFVAVPVTFAADASPCECSDAWAFSLPALMRRYETALICDSRSFA